MKKVIIVHRWEGSPEEPMLQWLKKELEAKGFEVIAPVMPNTEEPKIKEWIDKLKDVVKNPDEEVYFIGHSIGCQGVLRYLETLDVDVKIGGAIFIAPWMKLDEKTIKEEGEEVAEIAKTWVETPIDWDRVKPHADKFVCIFSDNDYYVLPVNKELFEEKLSAKTIIEHNKGHFTEEDDVIENVTAVDELVRISEE